VTFCLSKNEYFNARLHDSSLHISRLQKYNLTLFNVIATAVVVNVVDAVISPVIFVVLQLPFSPTCSRHHVTRRVAFVALKSESHSCASDDAEKVNDEGKDLDAMQGGDATPCDVRRRCDAAMRCNAMQQDAMRGGDAQMEVRQETCPIYLDTFTCPRITKRGQGERT
jgi:hypothetical protein